MTKSVKISHQPPPAPALPQPASTSLPSAAPLDISECVPGLSQAPAPSAATTTLSATSLPPAMHLSGHEDALLALAQSRQAPLQVAQLAEKFGMLPGDTRALCFRLAWFVLGNVSRLGGWERLSPASLQQSLFLLKPLYTPSVQHKIGFLYYLCGTAWYAQEHDLAAAAAQDCLAALQKWQRSNPAQQVTLHEKLDTVQVHLTLHEIVRELVGIIISLGVDAHALTQVTMALPGNAVTAEQYLGLAQIVLNCTTPELFYSLAALFYRRAMPYIKQQHDADALQAYASQVLLPLGELELAQQQLRLALSYAAPNSPQHNNLLFALLATLQQQGSAAAASSTAASQKLWRELATCYVGLIQARVPTWETMLPLLCHAWQRAASPKQALQAYKTLCRPAADETQAPLRIWQPLLQFYSDSSDVRQSRALLSLLAQQYARITLTPDWRQIYFDHLQAEADVAEPTHSETIWLDLEAQLHAATTLGEMQPLLQAVLQAQQPATAAAASLVGANDALEADQINLLAQIQSGQTGILPATQPTPNKRQGKAAARKKIPSAAKIAPPVPQPPAPVSAASTPAVAKPVATVTPPPAAVVPAQAAPALAPLTTYVLVNNVRCSATLIGTDFAGQLIARSSANTTHRVSEPELLEAWQSFGLAPQYGVDAAHSVPHDATLASALQTLGNRPFAPQLTVRHVLQLLTQASPYQLLFGRDSVAQLWLSSAAPTALEAYLANVTQLELVFNGPPQWLWQRCAALLPNHVRQDSQASYAMQQGNVQLRGGSAAQPLLLSCASMRCGTHHGTPGEPAAGQAIFGASLPAHTSSLNFSYNCLAADFTQLYDATGQSLAQLRARQLHLTASDDYAIGWRALLFLLQQPTFQLTPAAAERVQESLAALRFPINHAKAILKAKPPTWSSPAALQDWLANIASTPLLQSPVAAAAKAYLADARLADILWRLYSVPRTTPVWPALPSTCTAPAWAPPPTDPALGPEALTETRTESLALQATSEVLLPPLVLPTAQQSAKRAAVNVSKQAIRAAQQLSYKRQYEQAVSTLRAALQVYPTDLHLWNTLLHVRSIQMVQPHAATEIVQEMQQHGLRPDTYMYVTLLIGAAQKRQWDLLDSFLRQLQQSGYHVTLGNYRQLLTAICKAKKIKLAFQVFEQARDIVKKAGSRAELTTLYNIFFEQMVTLLDYDALLQICGCMTQDGVIPDLDFCTSYIIFTNFVTHPEDFDRFIQKLSQQHNAWLKSTSLPKLTENRHNVVRQVELIFEVFARSATPRENFPYSRLLELLYKTQNYQAAIRLFSTLDLTFTEKTDLAECYRKTKNYPAAIQLCDEILQDKSAYVREKNYAWLVKLICLQQSNMNDFMTMQAKAPFEEDHPVFGLRLLCTRIFGRVPMTAVKTARAKQRLEAAHTEPHNKNLLRDIRGALNLLNSRPA